FGAALGDIAVAQAVFFLGLVAPIPGVQRVHFQLGDAHQKARPGERLLVFLVVADHVADVLTEETLDALAELLRALDVDLRHPVFAGLQLLGRCERRYLPGLFVVEGDIADQITNHRESPQRRYGHDLVLGERGHPRHTHQPGLAVDFGRTRSALARLTV